MATKQRTTEFVSVSLGALAVACLTIGTVHGVEIAPDDLLIPPGLGAGDRFHLVFVTSPQNEVDSAWSIAQLNTYVNKVANNTDGYTGSVVASLGATWYGIGSDTAVDARNNAVVSAPVYRVDGVRIATGRSDLWDGSIENTIDVTEQNTAYTYTTVVRTGSNSDGTAATYPFGVPGNRISRGRTTYTDAFWIAGGSENDSVRRGAYAVSEEIHVVNPTGMLLLVR